MTGGTGRGWSRRDCLKLTAAGTALSALTASVAETSTSLDAVARMGGRRFGSAMGTRDLADPRYCDLMRRECGLLVAENEHKWYTVRAKPDRWAFERADALVGFAQQNGLGMRGHTLLWHHSRWLPQWLEKYDFGANPRAEAERMLIEYVDRNIARHGSLIRSWDVVNETVHEETGELRETAFTRHLGREAVVEIMFHAARRAAPNAELVYNDYMSWDASSAAHREGVLELLRSLLAKKVPVDALGIQSHLGMLEDPKTERFAPPQTREWRAFMDEVTGMGLRILITEFDVNDEVVRGDIATRDRAVADLGREYLDLMFSYPQLETVMAWGMVDHHSWLQGRTPRADGLPKRPTPYDRDYRAKPLREAIAAAFESAPKRAANT